MSTYFKYPEEVRRLIYTTNAIEGFNRQLRKVLLLCAFAVSFAAYKNFGSNTDRCFVSLQYVFEVFDRILFPRFYLDT